MKSIYVTPLGENKTEIRYGDKYVLFSYQTPVAYSDNTGKCYMTSTKYSNTTTRHIETWLNGRNSTSVSQKILDKVVE